MAGGTLGDNIGLREEVINKACALAFEAHNKSPRERYLSEKVRTSSPEAASYLIVSFPGSWVDTDWFATKPFGETKVDLALFPSLTSVGNDEAALVNEAFLKTFDRVLKTSSITSEVCNVTNMAIFIIVVSVILI